MLVQQITPSVTAPHVALICAAHVHTKRCRCGGVRLRLSLCHFVSPGDTPLDLHICPELTFYAGPEGE